MAFSSDINVFTEMELIKEGGAYTEMINGEECMQDAARLDIELWSISWKTSISSRISAIPVVREHIRV